MIETRSKWASIKSIATRWKTDLANRSKNNEPENNLWMWEECVLVLERLKTGSVFNQYHLRKNRSSTVRKISPNGTFFLQSNEVLDVWAIVTESNLCPEGFYLIIDREGERKTIVNKRKDEKLKTMKYSILCNERGWFKWGKSKKTQNYYMFLICIVGFLRWNALAWNLFWKEYITFFCTEIYLKPF